ncbi:MAG: glycosyltransferase [Nitrospira sp.]|nr:glycosyltransferase [Nitrospira sp.]
MPWLLWCFDRQTWPLRELVIVDSSVDPIVITGRPNVRVVPMPFGTSIPRKRNQALVEARGEIIAWFDDDDWQHPDKLSVLVGALDEDVSFAGSNRGWFVDLIHSKCRPYVGPKKLVVFNNAVFRRGAVQDCCFRENLPRASDTIWMQEVRKHTQELGAVVQRDDLFFWLCHQRNISNPVSKRRLTQKLTVLKDRVDREAWGNTDDALDALRERVRNEQQLNRQPVVSVSPVAVAPANPVRNRTSRLDPMQDTTSEENGRKNLPVTVVIKATSLDAPFLDVMVRHMIVQARYPFSERTIVVDRPRAFLGKYRTRPPGNQRELDRILQGLLDDHIIDHVREIDSTPSTVRAILERYFPDDALRVPTHAVTGGPIYATLFGLESAATDYVLQMDADVFFFVDSTSWVGDALQQLRLDPNLWLMMTHPGPPAGPVGKSLGLRNAKQAGWDGQQTIWRFKTATTRYFLCDRNRLHGRLRFVPMLGGCAPLERCISEALRQHGAFRGCLGNLKSWHLHAWFHGTPFPEWARPIAQAIESGCIPDLQRGLYDLRLDRPSDRLAWRHILDDGIPNSGFQPNINAACSETVTSDGEFSELERTPPGSAFPSLVSQKASQVEVLPPGKESGSNSTANKTAPIAVVIPVRDRTGPRLRNALASLNWQKSGRPMQVFVVSHGSQPAVDEEVSSLCREGNATLLKVGRPDEPWNKSLALNLGIRSTSPDISYVVTMDADMILAPDFFEVVLEKLDRTSPALVLCRISDLPADIPVPSDADELKQSFAQLHGRARLRPRYGSGAMQAVSRAFLFEIHGYDEDLYWWGAMDGDLVNRARLGGLNIVWIDNQTAMLHQWHQRKHSVLTDRVAAEQARNAWRFNHALVRARRGILRRNLKGWGGVSETQSSTVLRKS